jgi:CheY-like chemotaxis protein
MRKLTTFTVDRNDVDMRMRLRHSISSAHEFGESVFVATLREALYKLAASRTPIDIIFLSYQFSKQEVVDFVTSAREHPASIDTAMVMILPSGSTHEALLAESLSAGIDGFLLEPFSTEDLIKVSQLAERVSKEKTTTREFVAIKFLVRDQIRLLDAAYCLHRGSIDLSQTMAKLRALGEKGHELSASSTEMYFSLLIDLCERSMVPVSIPKNPYQGKSERTKRRVDQMLIANLESPKPKLDPRREVLVDGKVLKLPPASGDKPGKL